MNRVPVDNEFATPLQMVALSPVTPVKTLMVIYIILPLLHTATLMLIIRKAIIKRLSTVISAIFLGNIILQKHCHSGLNLVLICKTKTMMSFMVSIPLTEMAPMVMAKAAGSVLLIIT